MASGKQNIVVVGGGCAGVGIARQLSQKLPSVHSNYNLLLITERDVHVHLPAAIRMLVTSDDSLESSALIPYDQLFVNNFGTTKFGKVVSIEKNSNGTGGNVVLESAEKVPFRYLVVATGSIWEGPLAVVAEQKKELVSSVQNWREAFKKSKAVVIGGAGSVGLEFAGEILDVFPDTEITIVTAGSLPLSSAYPEKFRKDVLRRWSKRGVKFILDDRIDDVPEGKFTTIATAKGQKLNADLVLLTRGPKPNTDLLRSLGDDTLDERGYVKVSPTLQFANHPDIFAAGDIIAVNEQKQAAKAPGHAGVVTANLLSIITSKEPKKTYQTPFEGIFITDGKYHGAGYVSVLWGLTFGDTVVPMVKGRSLSNRELISTPLSDMLPPKRSTRSARADSPSIEVDSNQVDACDQHIDHVKLPTLLPRPADAHETEVQFVFNTPQNAKARFTLTESSRKRTRRKLTTPQRLALEDLARNGNSPSLESRRALADELGLELKVVSVWFQNKRRPSSKLNESTQVDDPESWETRQILGDVNNSTTPHEIALYKSGGPCETKSMALSKISREEGRTYPGIWDFLPSSPPGPASEASQSQSSLLENVPELIDLQKRHRSLEWACSNDKRSAKKSRTGSSPSDQESMSLLSPPVGTILQRQRTDQKPQSPTANTLRNGSSGPTNRSRVRHALPKSRSFDDQARIDKDVLDVALALIELKKLRDPQLLRKSN
ncbi:hypothetical protein ACEPAF_3785 [Sanghuangporus sanghuang]